MTTLQTRKKYGLQWAAILTGSWSLVALALAGLAGWVDFVTGDLSGAIFYLVPICLCLRVLGRTGGLGIALAESSPALKTRQQREPSEGDRRFKL
jgi:hypothetical protein